MSHTSKVFWWIAACIVCGTVVAWLTLRGGPRVSPATRGPRMEQLAREPDASEMRRKWAVVPKLSLLGLHEEVVVERTGQHANVLPTPEVLRAELTGLLRSRLAQSTYISATMIEKLAVRLYEEISARSAADGAEFSAMAAADTTCRWVTPNDKRWETLMGYTEYNCPSVKPDPADVPAAMRAIMDDLLSAKKSRYVGISFTSEGCSIKAYRCRGMEHFMQLEEESFGKTEFSKWYRNPGQLAVPFRMHKTTFDEECAKNQIATMVVCLFVVRLESGDDHVWCSRWWWDPSRVTWVNESTSKRGWHGVMCF